MRDVLDLGELHAEVTRKAIKHVHLSVLPPVGKVRVAAPQSVALDTIRLFVISKLAWIRSQQRKLQTQERETPREFLNKESLPGVNYFERPASIILSGAVEQDH